MKKKLLIIILALIMAVASAFALTTCGATNGNDGSNTGNNGNDDNTDNTTVVTPGGGNKDTDDNDNPQKPATEGLKYTLLADDAYEVTGYDGTATEINIPSTYNGKPVTSIGDNAFSGCSSLKTINCEAESQPEGWSVYWKSNCNATVKWGHTGK